MHATDPRSLTTIEPPQFLSRTLYWMRWATIGVVFLLVLLQPEVGRTRVPPWILIFLFVAYSLLTNWLQTWLPWSRFALWQAAVDLAMIGAIYYLQAKPGGPFFLLFFFAIACAAATLPLRLSLLYTAIAACTAVMIELSFVDVTAMSPQQYNLEARLAFLVLFGGGITVLLHGLLLQQQSFQVAREEAQRLTHLAEMREEFIATTSHDLRTPLTAARASLGMLSLSAIHHLREDEYELLENARRNVEWLNLLIDNLLAYNQLEAGTFHLECQPVDLVSVVHNAHALVQSLLRQKQQVVALELPETLPTKGDAQRLGQVLVNLLGNAYHHTPDGTHITISAIQTPQAIQLTISDNGPGIAPEKLETIFERFYQISLTARGSGLGLAIAKRIIELHGGQVWASSQLAVGTSFHLLLPSETE